MPGPQPDCQSLVNAGMADVARARPVAGHDGPQHMVKEQPVAMQCAAEQGMQSLRQDGWRKVLRGSTSVEEVVRAAKADHSLLLKKK